MIVQSIQSGAIKPSWISVDVRSISNNSTRANLSRVKRSSYGDASLNRQMFDRNSKQKTYTSLAIPLATLSTKQGISKGNGCLRSAARKGGSPHAPLAGIGLLYLGMHAFDAAALLGLLSSSICSISIVRSWPLLFDLVFFMDLCLTNVQWFDFGLCLRCYCTISYIVQDPASLTQLVRSLRELSHHLK